MSDRTQWVTGLVGLPYAGKSSLARALARTAASDELTAAIVCPDDVRLALHGQRFVPSAEPFVWAITRVMVDALLRSGTNCVILDATSITKKRRAEWTEERLGVPVIWYHVDTSQRECLRRAQEAMDFDILPIIDRMAQEAEVQGLLAPEGYRWAWMSDENPSREGGGTAESEKAGSR